MPMDKRLYPSNWDEIASHIKTEANWNCVACGRPCKRPDEDVGDHYERIKGTRWLRDYFGTDENQTEITPSPKVGRFVLTVAHLDHRPENCDPDNLRALCAPCHARYDLSQMAKKKMLKLERLGQLRLEGV